MFQKGSVKRNVVADDWQVADEGGNLLFLVCDGRGILDVSVGDAGDMRGDLRNRNARIDKKLESFFLSVEIKFNRAKFHDLITLRIKAGGFEI